MRLMNTSIINKKDAEGKFILAPLPFTDDYLEPFISAKTVRYHYYKHLKAYIDRINFTPINSTLESLITDLRSGFRTNSLYQSASQAYNHYLYFEQLHLKGAELPLDETYKLIKDRYGSLEELKFHLISAGISVFGSGWVFLIQRPDGPIDIVSYTGTYTPLNVKILLALDVWEHAYYLDYQNDREAYLESFFYLIDWKVVEKRLKKPLIKYY